MFLALKRRLLRNLLVIKTKGDRALWELKEALMQTKRELKFVD